MTFAHAAEKVGACESGRSLVSTEDRDNLMAERLYRMVTNWRCRPIATCWRFLGKWPAWRRKHTIEMSMEDCPNSGGELMAIAVIAKSSVIERILNHLRSLALGPAARHGDQGDAARAA